MYMLYIYNVVYCIKLYYVVVRARGQPPTGQSCSALGAGGETCARCTYIYIYIYTLL